MLQIARSSERIKKTKLNAKGISEIKNKWKSLNKIDFLIFHLVKDEASAASNIPSSVDALSLEGSDDKTSITINLGKYLDCSDILFINFKKIRERIDSILD